MLDLEYLEDSNPGIEWGVLGDDEELGEGGQDVHDVYYFQAGQVPPLVLAPLEEVHNRLGVPYAWLAVHQSYLKGQVPEEL